MLGELKLPNAFLLWWLVKAPKRIFTVGKRILIIVNNSISFTLNLRLIFTPLFGDYTLVGRFIGFCVRTVEIVLGLIVVIMLSLLVLASPVIWLLSPVILFLTIKFWVFLFYILLYISWAYINNNTPDKKINEILPGNELHSFRPVVKKILGKANINISDALIELFKLREIKYLLIKAELPIDFFKDKLLTAPRMDITNLKMIMFELAKKQNSRYVEAEHLLYSIITLLPKPEVFLSSFGISLKLLEKTTEWVISEKEHRAKMYIWQEECDRLFVGGIGKGMTGKITPFLDQHSEDFTKKVKNGTIKNIVGRDEEIKKIAELLMGTRQNILIIGDPGSGKTSIVRGMAYEIIKGTEYKSIQNRRIVSLDIGALVSGTKSVGDISAKANIILEEIKSSGDIILFIDEIHNMVAESGNSDSQTSAIYSILEPHLISDKIQFIGATSIPNYRKYIEPNGSFSRLFTIVEIKESSKDDTLEILKDRAREYQNKNNIIITYPALERMVELSEKLIQERVLPDKALDILNRSVTSVQSGSKLVNSDVVEKEISVMTNIPSENFTQDEAEKLLNIEEEMQKICIGQDHVVKQIGSALRRARAGIRNENKPIASFLFVGTTGVGKTQTAKALAQTYFGDKKAMIRIDMSEYQQLDSINRLIGTPDGKNKGKLTEAVRTKPFSLILLDEIEKAHPNILLLFLQVLDEGMLTDSSGMSFSFTNTIIIATSNVGTKSIQDIFSRGGSFEEMDKAALSDVRKNFAPEFLNRFSGIIVFNPLSKETVNKICLLLLEDVRRAAEEKGVKITFKNELIEGLVNRGYSPEWGARPLSRVIEDTVESYIATKLLKNEIKQGDELEVGIEALS